jgi:MYXO-CTERM domain-containing protein
LITWADDIGNGITFPVLDDSQSLLANRWGVSGIPSYTLIGRDMTYIIVNGHASSGDIETALDEPVPDVEWDEPPALDPEDSAEPGDVVDGESTAGDGASSGPTETFAGPWGGGPAPSDGAGVASPYGGCAASVASGGGGVAAFWLACLGLFGLVRRRQVQ